jgi:isoleucyl-tRNA synthetase
MRADSVGRRSAQTAIYFIVEALVRWIAPILSFTAEEIWKYLPGTRAESVFFSSWFELPAAAHQRPHIDWDKILELRSAVSRELEKLRATDAIGAPLDAEVDVYCAPALFEIVRQVGDELRFVFITSYARLHPAAARPANAVAAESGDDNQAWIVVAASTHGKCIRCRNKREDVGTHAAHPELCGRCVANVDGSGEQRLFA